MYAKTQIQMLNIPPIYRMQNILCLVYFAKDAEDCFGYDRINLIAI